MTNRSTIRRQVKSEIQVDDVINDRGQSARFEIGLALSDQLLALELPPAARALVLAQREILATCAAAEADDARRHQLRGALEALEEREEARNGQP